MAFESDSLCTCASLSRCFLEGVICGGLSCPVCVLWNSCPSWLCMKIAPRPKYVGFPLGVPAHQAEKRTLYSNNLFFSSFPKTTMFYAGKLVVVVFSGTSQKSVALTPTHKWLLASKPVCPGIRSVPAPWITPWGSGRSPRSRRLVTARR